MSEKIEKRTSSLPDILSALPEALREPYAMAQMMAASGYFPDVRSVSQAFTRLVFGKALGLSPLESMTGIYFVKGRLALSASLMASLVKRSGRYDYRVLELTEERCVIRFWAIRGGEREELGDSVFTLEDARRAGLADGENWRRYPRNMLFARALSNGVRWFCPDVLGGPVYEVSELQESGPPEADVVEIATVEANEPEPMAPEPEEPEPVASSSPQWDWTSFWSRVREMGLTALQAHRILQEATGVQNFLEYAKAGHTMEEALALLRRASSIST